MKINNILRDVSTAQGWDAGQQVIHLCGFIESLLDNEDVSADFEPDEHLQYYLETAVKKESGYCDDCCEPEHDICSMTKGCPCCLKTKQAGYLLRGVSIII